MSRSAPSPNIDQASTSRFDVLPAQEPSRTSLQGGLALGSLVAGYLLLAIVAGARGSPLVPPLPAGVAVPAWTSRAASALGLDMLGRAGLTVLSILILAALVAAFLVVIREAWRGRLRLRLVLIVSALCLAVVLAAPLLLSRDVYSYAAYGRMVALHGVNPYVEAPSAFPGDPFTQVVSRSWIDTRSVYGPAFTLISAGVAGVTRASPAATIVVFKVLSAAAVWLAALLCAVACRGPLAHRAPFAAAVVGISPVLVVHTVAAGDNDALVALFLSGALLLAVWSVQTRAPRAAGRPSSGAFALGATIFLTLGSLIKVVVALPLLLWAVSCVASAPVGRRLRVASIHTATAGALALLLTAPLYAGKETASALLNLASVEGWASGSRLVARGAQALGGAIAGPGLATVLKTATYVLFLVVLAVIFWKMLLRARAEAPAEVWGPTLLLFVIGAPYVPPSYVAWFAPFLGSMRDRFLVGAGLAAASVLAVTGVPAEPGTSPQLWRNMLLAVHYAAAPVILGVFCLAVARVLRPDPSVVEPGQDRHLRAASPPFLQ